MSTYDILDDSSDIYLQDAFDAQVLEYIVMSELSCPVAWTCASHQGLHINSDYLVVEILNLNSDDPVPPKTVGEVVITDLQNYLMPLIRYRTGDLASYIPGLCSCGRALPLITPIEGRISSSLFLGSQIITVRDVLKQVAPLGIDDVQVQLNQETKKIILKYVPDNINKSIDISDIRGRLSLLFRSNNITIQPVMYLDRTSSGKFYTFVIEKT